MLIGHCTANSPLAWQRRVDTSGLVLTTPGWRAAAAGPLYVLEETVHHRDASADQPTDAPREDGTERLGPPARALGPTRVGQPQPEGFRR